MTATTGFGKSGGIYLSLPFCLSHCHYCSNPAASYSDERAVAYTQRLVDDLIAAAPAWHGHQIDTIYLGGGTPTLFKADLLAELLGTIRRHFAVAEDAEITSEANPETVTDSLSADLIHLGVNRISIGAQSFQPAFLMALGRRHTPEAVHQAVAAARGAGFDNLSLDLIFGIPGQNAHQWRDDIATAVALKPNHLSAYILTLEDGTQLTERVAAGRAQAPDEAACAELYGISATALSDAGFARYEVSSFAQPGKRCRHNLNYWQGGDWLGLGAGAGSSLDNQRWACPTAVEGYLGAEPNPWRETLSPLEQAHEMAIFAMRTTEGARLDAILAATGIDLGIPLQPHLNALLAEGLINRHGPHIWPTQRGFLFNDAIGTALAAVPNVTPLTPL